MDAKKITAIALAVVAAAGLVFFITRKPRPVRVLDKFNIDRSAFPYVNWNAALKLTSVAVEEILDYRTFRTDEGSIVQLCGIGRPLKRGSAKAFLKREILNKKVVVAIYGSSREYSGVFYGTVFYDRVSKCLNRGLYEKGLAKVEIKDRYFFRKKWFNAEAG